jgi:hypothetical protein
LYINHETCPSSMKSIHLSRGGSWDHCPLSPSLLCAGSRAAGSLRLRRVAAAAASTLPIHSPSNCYCTSAPACRPSPSFISTHLGTSSYYYYRSPFPTPPHHQVLDRITSALERWCLYSESEYHISWILIVDGVDLRYFWLGRRLIPNHLLPPILGISELWTALWTIFVGDLYPRLVLRQNPRHQLQYHHHHHLK